MYININMFMPVELYSCPSYLSVPKFSRYPGTCSFIVAAGAKRIVSGGVFYNYTQPSVNTSVKQLMMSDLPLLAEPWTRIVDLLNLGAQRGRSDRFIAKVKKQASPAVCF